ncbi:flagellar basal body protein [Janthinobacterium agaricidamnosum]|uniref:Flagella basal body rod family protein n=1 Tax=Janthinobacterium agaricidamnosum NBRC 102515 = DSM 9628 TaxID=1349767 RepID=W0V0Q8_9BURK|nr:flagellar basal body protein [Janthinobacterium agaricidamnosum]CDG82419.1 flagella basal body rod family protein [Janthinobacterium agaricidamnosum NBRC 102515 = DSM 9628]
MSTISGPLSAGVSGISANQRALDVAGHNIANANTANLKAQQASFQESSPAGSGVTLSVEGRNLAANNLNRINGPETKENGVNLNQEVNNTLVYKLGAQLSANVVKSADQALGSVIDVKT